jgi:hypothetical protein
MAEGKGLQQVGVGDQATPHTTPQFQGFFFSHLWFPKFCEIFHNFCNFFLIYTQKTKRSKLSKNFCSHSAKIHQEKEEGCS